MAISCSSFEGKFCTMSTPVFVGCRELPQRLIKMFEVWNFYIREQLKEKYSLFEKKLIPWDSGGSWLHWEFRCVPTRLDLALIRTKIANSHTMMIDTCYLDNFFQQKKKSKWENLHCKHFPAHSCFLPILITGSSHPLQIWPGNADGNKILYSSLWV